MPEISAGAQIFDLAFHPTHSTVYTGLLTGHVRAFAYNDQGHAQRTFSVRPSKRSCRAVCLDHDGSHLYAVGRSKALNIIDTVTEDLEIRAGAHDSAINRIKYIMPSLFCTGDDDGIIKLWDPRKKECIRKYSHHFDYITDFLWLEDKKHLVATRYFLYLAPVSYIGVNVFAIPPENKSSSGDGTLSVMDIRSKKIEPFAQSEDQEDELLSVVAIKSGSKVVVGTQIGILSIFNRNAGWGDCVDRIPGHPHSVDALCTLPPDISGVDTGSTILTGSSDGYVRAIEILPTKLLGVVADHGDWPVERIAIGCGTSQLTLDASETDKNGTNVGKKNDDDVEDIAKPQRKWWVGSVGHEETLRLTDLEAFFHETGKDGDKDVYEFMDTDEEQKEVEDVEEDDDASEHSDDDGSIIGPRDNHDRDEDSDSEEVLKGKKRKRKPEKNPPAVQKKGKNAVDVAEATFFDDL